MDVFPDSFRQFFRILGIFFQNLRQDRIIYQFGDAQFPGVAVHIMDEINHHAGKHLHIALLCLDIDEGYRTVLDGIRQFCCHLGAGSCQKLPCCGIDYILSQHCAADTVSQHKLFIEFISADFGQIISSGVKEHGINQAFRTFHTQRLAGTDLFIQL